MLRSIYMNVYLYKSLKETCINSACLIGFYSCTKNYINCTFVLFPHSRLYIYTYTHEPYQIYGIHASIAACAK